MKKAFHIAQRPLARWWSTFRKNVSFNKTPAQSIEMRSYNPFAKAA
jgi:hypothetical protein